MFIGGLNWETTDASLKEYFSQFGEVQECTVMRDAATGRSRGFGFLTFKDPKTVNIVMVKEHFLDGKIIDPKRAIPRDEQEKTSKIFVGGVSQEATEQDFKEYFMQFGRVIDATLMMDKDTGRPRGFGFVTFDNEAAVDATLQGDLMILGKPIEVKKAQPRGNIRDEDDQSRRGGRGRGSNDRFHGDASGQMGGQNNPGFGGGNGMTPQMMAQYWQRMQQYFAQMSAQFQNQMMGGMNPAMMQQMKQMQQMQQMQAMQQMQNQGNQQGSQSPMQGNSNAQAPNNMQGMNPSMMANMMGGQGNGQMGGVPSGPSQGNFDGNQKPDQQGRMQGGGGQWDDNSHANMGPQGGGRGGGYGRGGPHRHGPKQASSAPANAPTGPKNAGVPGANYRGGGRGHHRGYHPYSRR